MSVTSDSGNVDEEQRELVKTTALDLSIISGVCACLFKSKTETWRTKT